MSVRVFYHNGALICRRRVGDQQLPQNTPPVASDYAYSVTGDTLVVDAPGLLSLCSDYEDNLYGVELVDDSPQGNVTVDVDGRFVYQRSTNAAYSTTFTYRASDVLGLYSNTATITLNVAAIATTDPPTAVADAYTVGSGLLYTRQAPGVLANDTGEGTLTAVLVSGPSHGTLNLSSNGAFTYQSTAAYTGADSFTYRCYNGTDYSSPVAVALTVVAVNATTIDAGWLAVNGPEPYLLSQANTTYTLATDVTVDGTAFCITGQNITFDLDGHTITYDNRTPINVANGGFEDGAIGAAPPNWDLTGAPTAAVVANTYAAFGDKVLLISSLSSDATIESDPIAITETRQYCAAAFIKGPGNCDAHIYIVNSDTDAVLATGYHSTSMVGRGFALPTVVSIASGTNVKIRIVVHGENSTWFVIDGVQLRYWRDYGVYFKPNWASSPDHLIVSRITSSGTYADNCVVKNGSIIQGQGGSALSDAVYANSRISPDAQDLSIEINGLDTAAVRVTWATDAVVDGCTIDATDQKFISNRMQLYSCIYALRSGGLFTSTDNTITGNPLIGIACTGDPGRNSQVLITGNTIHSDTRYTEGYGIACAGPLVDGLIDSNTITTTTSGRGILLDSEDSYGDSLSVTISNNVIDIQEYPNLEYGPTGAGLEGTGIRIRGRSGESFTGLRVFGNNVTAACGDGTTNGGIAIRVSLSDECTDVEIHDNVFKAICNTTNTSKFAQAVSWSGVRALALPLFYDNVAISNHVCMAWADIDSWSVPTVNTTCQDTTLQQSAEGAARTFYPLSVGYGPVDCTGHTIYGTVFAGGATHQIQFAGSGAIGMTFGYTLDVTVTNATTQAPIAGVAVSLTDAASVVYDLGVTDANGQIAQANVITHIYGGTGTSPTTSVKTPHTLTLTKTGFAPRADVVNFNGNKAILTTLQPI